MTHLKDIFDGQAKARLLCASIKPEVLRCRSEGEKSVENKAVNAQETNSHFLMAENTVFKMRQRSFGCSDIMECPKEIGHSGDLVKSVSYISS